MAKRIDPLRKIIERPNTNGYLTEKLECGHTVMRPLALGEPAQEPSKAIRRRCHFCGAKATGAQ
jgi:hypothetical protein